MWLENEVVGLAMSTGNTDVALDVKNKHQYSMEKPQEKYSTP
jgi:hypothetical protein